MKIINNELLYSLSIQSKENSEMRAKYCLNVNEEGNARKVLNVMEMGAKVPVNVNENGDETIIVLKGKLKVNIYNDDKEVSSEVFLDPKVGNYGLEIPRCVMHNLEVLEGNTVVLQIK